MTERHKDFGRSSVEIDEKPVSFNLEGQTFACKPAINGAVLLDFVRNADSGSGGRASDALLGLFKKVLYPESFDRFEKITTDPDIPIQVETLGEICGWLVEVYTDRPTKVRSVSSLTQETTGRTSMAVASVPE